MFKRRESSGDAAYRYQALNASPAPIRLLHLNTPKFRAPFWSLEHYDLAQAPPYRALSYAWGAQQSKQHILLGGKRLEIGQNLFDFLNTVPRRITGTYLWVDQICINQESKVERSQQVGIMDQIYKSAEQVIIWLGPVSEHTEDLSHVVEWLRNQYDVRGLQRNSIVERSDVDNFTIHVHPTITFPVDWKSMILTSKGQRALNDFCEREYWSRLWPIQEILLARMITLTIGHLDFSWTDLDLLQKTMGFYIPGDSAMLRLKHQRDLVHHTGSAQNKTYWDLRTFISSECADVRDKLYGFLSLIWDTPKPSFNYSKPVARVYLDAVSLYFRKPATTLGHHSRRDLIHRFEQSLRLGKMMLPDRRWPTDELTLGLGPTSVLKPTPPTPKEIKLLQHVWPDESESFWFDAEEAEVTARRGTDITLLKGLDMLIDDADFELLSKPLLEILDRFIRRDEVDVFERIFGLQQGDIYPESQEGHGGNDIQSS